MDFLSFMPIVGIFMFATGIRHARSEPGITKDRVINVPFLLLVVPGLLNSFPTIGQATPVQLMIFLCGLLGLVGAALSISTMYPDRKRAPRETIGVQRSMSEARDA